MRGFLFEKTFILFVYVEQLCLYLSKQNKVIMSDYYNTEYDFYYSKIQDERMSGFIPVFGSPERKDTFINGIKYTEMIQKGRKPLSKFKDLKKVYTGKPVGITFK